MVLGGENMNSDQNRSAEIAKTVADAYRNKESLSIRAGGSKAFYGRPASGALLDLSTHRGIVSYEPTELYVTARAATPLAEITALLSEHQQLLPFEPPDFPEGSSAGGVLASGLSGPRRPYAGAVRDAVLGVRLLNGRGEVYGFGGQVMKNVAGYDLSRLMAGAMGTLGVVLEMTFKVTPAPEVERTMQIDAPMAETFAESERLLREGMPVSGACHDGQCLFIRLSGSGKLVEDCAAKLDAEPFEGDGASFWTALTNQRLPFFADRDDAPLWRSALAAAAPSPELDGDKFLDWGGRLLWLRSGAEAESIRQQASRLGGHATQFRGGDRSQEVFQRPPPPLFRIHQRLKQALDPGGILNPGRLYKDL